MTMVLNEEQRLLQDTAGEFLAANAPVSALRALRDSRDALGYSLPLWQQMAELGWAGIIVPEEFGGLGFGFAGLAAVQQQCGRTLAASPLLATCALGASAILLGGSRQQKESILPPLVRGELCLALALEESPHHDPLGVMLEAKRSGADYVLNGSKQFVLDGHSAGSLIVVARSRGDRGDRDGISLFLLNADTAGIVRRRTLMMDSRNAARIDFNDVRVAADGLIGIEGEGYPILEQVLDRGRAVLAAEMLGGIRATFERTIDYLKQREQFGALIGSFQALQHRAAHMFSEIELCHSVVLEACSAVDENTAMLPLLASLAKARANDCYELVSNEAVQMHGGIGTTDALDIGLFLKRARVCMQALGDARFHRSRYASLRGF